MRKENVYLQPKGPHQSVGVHIPNSRGHTELGGAPYPLLKVPRQSGGVHIPDSRCHATLWESTCASEKDAPTLASPYPQVKGPRQNVGACIPNSRGRMKMLRHKVGVRIPL